LEIVIRDSRHKDCLEALRLLAQVKGRIGKPGESVDLFKRVLELNPNDFEANIEIGQVFEQTDCRTAIVYYENAVKILRSQHDRFPHPEILVTLGTLRFEVGKVEEAE
jgi:tetratricopeptide (TPR) repeat protein